MHVVIAEKPLLDYLLECFPRVNRTTAKQILKHGSAMVNDRPIAAHDHLLRVGDRLKIISKRSASNHSAFPRLSFPLIYEDDDLIVIDKPAGLLTMGTAQDNIHTAYRQLTDYACASSADGRGRIFIVHRLDREASGLVLFARNERVKEALQTHWAQVQKKYYALIEGRPRNAQGTIEGYLVEDRCLRVHSASAHHPAAKRAVTHYQALRAHPRYSLLEVRLETGRKNQIRVHLADLGHPIVGDRKYGSRVDPLGRMGLHACYLQFPHPVIGAMITLESALPPAFAKLVIP